VLAPLAGNLFITLQIGLHDFFTAISLHFVAFLKGGCMTRNPLVNVRALILTLLVTPLLGFAQAPDASSGETSTDLFVMFGSDFVRPGLLPRANYNIGIGHTFGFLKKDPVGDEITISYTYENAGSHGFFGSNYGSNTETLGVMKNFALPKTKRVSAYTWIQGGLTSMTGYAAVKNRFYNGESLGAVVHLNGNRSIWIQETYNKVVTTPWYTTTSFGYTWSW
jgi:hypothetical protein